MAHRVPPTPHCADTLRQQLLHARAVWEKDRQSGQAGVEVPDALEVKYPKVGQSGGWFWLLPAQGTSTDPRSGVIRRHHVS